MTAPMVLDGPMTAAWFLSYVQQVLVPTLASGDVVILDNSPDFNPIENAFSKLKALLRKAAARTIDELWAVIGSSLDAFTPAECANSFTAAGYDAW